MGDRHIKIKVENERVDHPNLKSICKHKPYTMFISRHGRHWNGSGYLSLRDLEIIRDFLNQYIYEEKLRRNKK